MSTLELKVYEILKAKLGEKEAEAVMDYFEAKAENIYNEKKDVLTTKEDLLNVRNDLQKQISETKADIIKWMFIFWTGSIITILGGLFVFLKLFVAK